MLRIDADVRGKHAALYNELLYQKHKDPLEEQRAIEYDRRYVYVSTIPIPVPTIRSQIFAMRGTARVGNIFAGSVAHSILHPRAAFA
jgi:hypothetical protein